MSLTDNTALTFGILRCQRVKLHLTPLWFQEPSLQKFHVSASPLNIIDKDSVCTFCLLTTCWVIGPRGVWWTNANNVHTMNLFCSPKDSFFLFSPQQIENYICNLILKHSECAFLGAINRVWAAFYVSFLYIHHGTYEREEIKDQGISVVGMLLSLLHKRKQNINSWNKTLKNYEARIQWFLNILQACRPLWEFDKSLSLGKCPFLKKMFHQL